MRPYTSTEIHSMRRIAEAVVPQGCHVQAASLEQGWLVSLIICGHTTCRTYDIRPPMGRQTILAISEAWETGEYVAAASDRRIPEKPRHLRSEAELQAWLAASRRDMRASYYEGSLAHFRQTANVQLRKLQALSDRKTGKTKRWARKASEMEALSQQLDLLKVVDRLHMLGVVNLVQQRLPQGDGSVYFVVRK